MITLDITDNTTKDLKTETLNFNHLEDCIKHITELDKSNKSISLYEGNYEIVLIYNDKTKQCNKTLVQKIYLR